MELKNLIKVRRLALVAVVANLIGLVVAALVLPRELRVIVPVLALIVPLLTTALLESVAEKRLGPGALAA